MAFEEFTVHRMRRGQQLARRLAAQHITAMFTGQAEGGVGLPALELLDLQRAPEAGDMGLQPAHVGDDLACGVHVVFPFLAHSFAVLVSLRRVHTG